VAAPGDSAGTVGAESANSSRAELQIVSAVWPKEGKRVDSSIMVRRISSICLLALSIILFFTSSQAPVKAESPPRGTTAQLDVGLNADDSVEMRHVTATVDRSKIRSTIFLVYCR